MGRFDIIAEVSLLVSHLALHREGHIEGAIHVKPHVGQKYNTRLVYNPLYPEIDHSVFKEYNWSEIYRSFIGMPRRPYL